ncbi:MAG: AarF/ABC1/UbiB kinase family protein [Archangium sp.]|nr:AarF/ABC1/UbiB kinase family protein [Archangium sp.]
MTDDPYSKPATGRLARMAKLASLSARLSTDLVSRGVKRLAGESDTVASLLGSGAAEKLVATLGDMKGLAMKLGQSMAMDPDMLTPEVRAIVARLQNQAPPMPWSLVEHVVTAQLGRPVAELFSSFDEAPLAAASLGQVHRAVTRDGSAVAVKVQYPDIADALQADVQNLGALVRTVSMTPGLSHGPKYFAELREGLLSELDYRQEARRLERFAAAARFVPTLRVPAVHHALTAEKVLTLELLDGVTLKEFLRTIDTQPPDERFRVARLLVHATWGPFLADGVVHADPHPGNFLVLPDGRLGVLDFGAIKEMSKPWLDANLRLFGSFFGENTYDAVADSAKAGMVFDDVAVARPIVEAVITITTRSARSTDFDYGAAHINRDMRALFLGNPRAMTTIKPPPEAVNFFRAVGGMSNNLENLKARGNFKALFREVYELALKSRKSP